MGYNFKSVPTEYRGFVFRSRLEATWAAFFDNAGFGWQYEPYDLSGWCPDFVITHHDFLPKEMMVEVKPSWDMAREKFPQFEKSGVDQVLCLLNAPDIDAGFDFFSLDGVEGETTFCRNPGWPLGVLWHKGCDNDCLVFSPRGYWRDYWASAFNATAKQY